MCACVGGGEGVTTPIVDRYFSRARKLNCYWGRPNQKLHGAPNKNSFFAPAENMRQAATGSGKHLKYNFVVIFTAL